MDNNTIMAIAAGTLVFIGLGWWIFGSSGSSTTNTNKTKEDIIKLLEQQGYQVKDVDFDDSIYEVEAYQHGKEFEIKLDITGKILNIKEDD